MFNKLKNQIKEKSGSDSVSVVSNVRKSSNKHMKSNQSDGAQSSDDTSSLKSAKLTLESDKFENETMKRSIVDENNTTSQFKENHVSNSNELVNSFKNENNSNNIEIKNSNNDQDSSIKLQLQQLNQSLLNQIDVLNNELNQKLVENEELRSKIIQFNSQIEDYEIEQEKCKIELNNYKLILTNYEFEIKTLKNDKDELIIKNAELSEKYELLKLVNNKQSHQNHIINDTEIHKSNILNRSDSNNQGASSLNVTEEISQKNTEVHYHTELQKFVDENKELRDELSEKNKTIKNLQQRLNDIKKTLQKEIKYQLLPNEKAQTDIESQPIQKPVVNNPSNHNTLNQKSPITSNGVQNQPFTNLKKQSSQLTFMTPLAMSNSSTSLGVKKNLSNSDMSGLHDDVNFKYLKHVVLKFLTSREYEALHLVKALSVLLDLSKEEEKVLRETLQWKMSWFGGSKPKLL